MCKNNTISFFDSNGLARTIITLPDGSKIKMKNPTGTQFFQKLQELCNEKKKVKKIWLYGHGNNDEMYINDSHMKWKWEWKSFGREMQKGDVALLVIDGKIMLYEDGGVYLDITQLLKCISDNETTIYLNGCHTAQDSKWLFPAPESIAKNMSEILKGGIIMGNTGYALGLYFWTIGDSEGYLEGEHK